MANEIAGRDQRPGEEGERRPWGLELGIVAATGEAWSFILLASSVLLLFWSRRRKPLRPMHWVKAIRTNLYVVGSCTHLADVEGFDLCRILFL